MIVYMYFRFVFFTTIIFIDSSMDSHAVIINSCMQCLQGENFTILRNTVFLNTPGSAGFQAIGHSENTHAPQITYQNYNQS